MNYCYCNTTKVYFSNSIAVDVNEFIKGANYSRAFLIAGGESTSSIAKEICTRLEVETFLISGVSTNPTAEIVNDISIKARYFNPDVILTVGGGSVHDCGKAVSIMYYDSVNSIEDYAVNGKFSVPGIKKSIPVITIPTIIGSGAEVSPAALIRIRQEKRVVFSPILHPVATFIDSMQIKKVPQILVNRSIFDLFIQALEGYISTAANTISDVFAIQTLKIFNDCYNDIKSWKTIGLKQIEKLAIASIFSSYVCSTASVGAIHALSDPISGRYNIHHGVALAMVAYNVLNKNFNNVPLERIETVNNILSNIVIDNSCEKPLKLKVLEKIKKIIDDFSLLKGIQSIVVDSQMVKECRNPDMNGNPYQLSDKEIEEILREIKND